MQEANHNVVFFCLFVLLSAFVHNTEADLNVFKNEGKTSEEQRTANLIRDVSNLRHGTTLQKVLSYPSKKARYKITVKNIGQPEEKSVSRTKTQLTINSETGSSKTEEAQKILNVSSKDVRSKKESALNVVGVDTIKKHLKTQTQDATTNDDKKVIIDTKHINDTTIEYYYVYEDVTDESKSQEVSVLRMKYSGDMSDYSSEEQERGGEANAKEIQSQVTITINVTSDGKDSVESGTENVLNKEQIADIYNQVVNGESTDHFNSKINAVDENVIKHTYNKQYASQDVVDSKINVVDGNVIKNTYNEPDAVQDDLDAFNYEQNELSGYYDRKTKLRESSNYQVNQSKSTSDKALDDQFVLDLQKYKDQKYTYPNSLQSLVVTPGYDTVSPLRSSILMNDKSYDIISTSNDAVTIADDEVDQKYLSGTDQNHREKDYSMDQYDYGSTDFGSVTRKDEKNSLVINKNNEEAGVQTIELLNDVNGKTSQSFPDFKKQYEISHTKATKNNMLVNSWKSRVKETSGLPLEVNDNLKTIKANFTQPTSTVTYIIKLQPDNVYSEDINLNDESTKKFLSRYQSEYLTKKHIQDLIQKHKHGELNENGHYLPTKTFNLWSKLEDGNDKEKEFKDVIQKHKHEAFIKNGHTLPAKTYNLWSYLDDDNAKKDVLALIHDHEYQSYTKGNDGNDYLRFKERPVGRTGPNASQENLTEKTAAAIITTVANITRQNSSQVETGDKNNNYATESTPIVLLEQSQKDNTTKTSSQNMRELLVVSTNVTSNSVSKKTILDDKVPQKLSVSETSFATIVDDKIPQKLSLLEPSDEINSDNDPSSTPNVLLEQPLFEETTKAENLAPYFLPGDINKIKDLPSTAPIYKDTTAVQNLPQFLLNTKSGEVNDYGLFLPKLMPAPMLKQQKFKEPVAAISPLNSYNKTTVHKLLAFERPQYEESTTVQYESQLLSHSVLSSGRNYSISRNTKNVTLGVPSSLFPQRLQHYKYQDINSGESLSQPKQDTTSSSPWYSTIDLLTGLLLNQSKHKENLETERPIYNFEDITENPVDDEYDGYSLQDPYKVSVNEKYKTKFEDLTRLRDDSLLYRNKNQPSAQNKVSVNVNRYKNYYQTKLDNIDYKHDYTQDLNVFPMDINNVKNPKVSKYYPTSPDYFNIKEKDYLNDDSGLTVIPLEKSSFTQYPTRSSKRSETVTRPYELTKGPQYKILKKPFRYDSESLEESFEFGFPKSDGNEEYISISNNNNINYYPPFSNNFKDKGPIPFKSNSKTDFSYQYGFHNASYRKPNYNIKEDYIVINNNNIDTYPPFNVHLKDKKPEQFTKEYDSFELKFKNASKIKPNSSVKKQYIITTINNNNNYKPFNAHFKNKDVPVTDGSKSIYNSFKFGFKKHNPKNENNKSPFSGDFKDKNPILTDDSHLSDDSFEFEFKNASNTRPKSDVKEKYIVHIKNNNKYGTLNYNFKQKDSVPVKDEKKFLQDSFKFHKASHTEPNNYVKTTTIVKNKNINNNFQISNHFKDNNLVTFKDNSESMDVSFEFGLNNSSHKKPNTNVVKEHTVVNNFNNNKYLPLSDYFKDKVPEPFTEETQPLDDSFEFGFHDALYNVNINDKRKHNVNKNKYPTLSNDSKNKVPVPTTEENQPLDDSFEFGSLYNVNINDKRKHNIIKNKYSPPLSNYFKQNKIPFSDVSETLYDLFELHNATKTKPKRYEKEEKIFINKKITYLPFIDNFKDQKPVLFTDDRKSLDYPVKIGFHDVLRSKPNIDVANKHNVIRYLPLNNLKEKNPVPLTDNSKLLKDSFKFEFKDKHDIVNKNSRYPPLNYKTDKNSRLFKGFGFGLHPRNITHTKPKSYVKKDNIITKTIHKYENDKYPPLSGYIKDKMPVTFADDKFYNESHTNLKSNDKSKHYVDNNYKDPILKVFKVKDNVPFSDVKTLYDSYDFNNLLDVKPHNDGKKIHSLKKSKYQTLENAVKLTDTDYSGITDPLEDFTLRQTKPKSDVKKKNNLINKDSKNATLKNTVLGTDTDYAGIDSFEFSKIMTTKPISDGNKENYLLNKGSLNISKLKNNFEVTDTGNFEIPDMFDLNKPTKTTPTSYVKYKENLLNKNTKYATFEKIAAGADSIYSGMTDSLEIYKPTKSKPKTAGNEENYLLNKNSKYLTLQNNDEVRGTYYSDLPNSLEFHKPMKAKPKSYFKKDNFLPNENSKYPTLKNKDEVSDTYNSDFTDLLEFYKPTTSKPNSYGSKKKYLQNKISKYQTFKDKNQPNAENSKLLFETSDSYHSQHTSPLKYNKNNSKKNKRKRKDYVTSKDYRYKDYRDILHYDYNPPIMTSYEYGDFSVESIEDNGDIQTLAFVSKLVRDKIFKFMTQSIEHIEMKMQRILEDLIKSGKETLNRTMTAFKYGNMTKLIEETVAIEMIKLLNSKEFKNIDFVFQMYVKTIVLEIRDFLNSFKIPEKEQLMIIKRFIHRLSSSLRRRYSFLDEELHELEDQWISAVVRIYTEAKVPVHNSVLHSDCSTIFKTLFNMIRKVLTFSYRK